VRILSGTTGRSRADTPGDAAKPAAAVFGPLFKAAEGSVSAQKRVNRRSSPDGLRITGMRACRLAANYDYPLIKIYANQDLYGVRCATPAWKASPRSLSRIGRPGSSEYREQSKSQFAGHGRTGGGYSAVDMAPHDIAGKVYSVPAYRLIGAKRYDRIRTYADTTDHKDPKVYAERLRKRKAIGLTFFKMDRHSNLMAERPGALNAHGVSTEKGLGYLCESIDATCDVIGEGTPLAADHFGRSTSTIRSATPEPSRSTSFPGPKTFSRPAKAIIGRGRIGAHTRPLPTPPHPS